MSLTTRMLIIIASITMILVIIGIINGIVRDQPESITKHKSEQVQIPQVPYDWMKIGKVDGMSFYLVEIDNIEYTIVSDYRANLTILNKKQLQ